MTLRSWSKRIKTLKYRDQGNTSQQGHQEHWRGFQWNGGPVVCSWAGDWGEVQVWAASEAEGQRVINHACAIAGIPPVGSPEGEFSSSTANSSRNGRPGVFRTVELNDYPVVSKRDGPSGSVIL